jgi:hypothetical protein
MNVAEQLGQYVASVFDPGDWVETRHLRNGEGHKGWTPANALPQQQKHFAALNDQGWNIYAGANPRTARGQSGDEAVSLCRCLFADFDGIKADGVSRSEIVGCRIDDAGLPVATLMMNSGHGIHTYWRLAEPIDPERWKALQIRLNFTLGSDPAIKNPERIMRLPGFANVKAEPVPCEIIDADASRVYALADIENHLQDAPEPEPLPAPAKPVGGRPKATTLFARATLYANKWPAVGEGSRNSEAYLHACQLRAKFDLPDGDVWELLTAWNAGNLPPLPETELRATVESAKKHANNGPGSEMTTSYQYEPDHGTVPVTTPPPSPASELQKLIEDEISGRITNIAWPWPIVTDLGQCLTPGTRTLIVGSIGGSKSLATLQAALFWVELDIKIALLELERGRDFHLKRVLAQRAGIADITKPQWVKENSDTVRRLFIEHRDCLNRMGAAIHIAPRQFTTVQAAEWIEQRASEGCRIIIVDPVTALARRGDPWKEDDAFMSRVEKAATQYGASLVFVTHAKKGAGNLPDVDSLAGSTAWARFADAILWLQSHDTKLSTVKTPCGTDEQTHNRTLHLLKTRSGEGTGLRLAYRFEVGRNDSDHGALTLRELGIIVKSKK